MNLIHFGSAQTLLKMDHASCRIQDGSTIETGHHTLRSEVWNNDLVNPKGAGYGPLWATQGILSIREGPPGCKYFLRQGILDKFINHE